MRKLGLDPKAEVKFHRTRRWRFDIADKKKKIAVEIQGGLYQVSGHTTAIGIQQDMEKYNAATAGGWRLFLIPSTGSPIYRKKRLALDAKDIIKQIRQVMKRDAKS